VAFLCAAMAYYAGLGVTMKRLLTDNGAAFHSKAFGAACPELGIRQKFTRAYRPQTTGKAERFIQSALRNGPTSSPTTIPRIAAAYSSLGSTIQLASTACRNRRLATPCAGSSPRQATTS
jgi:transposase InsO family protein